MLQLTSESLLKRTVSRCPTCHQSAPAEVWRRNENGKQTVWLRRRCAEHGAAEVCISSDARFYWVAQGSPENRCACKSAGDGGYEGTLGTNALRHDASECETLSTCLALIEIVNSCNLACPTCYADSSHAKEVDAVPLSDLQRRIQGVIDRKGRIEILQLSGGEPTLHPQFFELLTWCHANPGLDYVLLNTNGMRIAMDDAFSDQLGKTFRYGKFQLYLQFDGPQLAAQHTLRGADLRKVREKVIERCGHLGIPVTLAMTVTLENLPHLWDSIECGLRWSHVRGISFQPMFTSGRTPLPTLNTQHSTSLNTADIILGAVEQSSGVLKFEDFTPLPCGDPNCATIGYLLRTPAGLRSISDFVDFSQVQGFLRDKVRYSLDDLAQCGCESQPLGRLLHDFELNETSTFRLFIKPFMDAWTWDEDRIDRCCTHVIRPDGALDSFCRYYAGASR
jgi:7,8-dihydro-6-hydroxymethylpterin dimethyltransferase